MPCPISRAWVCIHVLVLEGQCWPVPRKDLVVKGLVCAGQRPCMHMPAVLGGPIALINAGSVFLACLSSFPCLLCFLMSRAPRRWLSRGMFCPAVFILLPAVLLDISHAETLVIARHAARHAMSCGYSRRPTSHGDRKEGASLVLTSCSIFDLVSLGAANVYSYTHCALLLSSPPAWLSTLLLMLLRARQPLRLPCPHILLPCPCLPLPTLSHAASSCLESAPCMHPHASVVRCMLVLSLP